MPFEVAPNKIELAEVQGGYAPDALESQVPLNASPDALNVFPRAQGLELREGFTRLSAGRLVSLAASHWIRHANYYEVIDGGSRKRYIMCVLTNGLSAANNVRVYAYDLVNNTFTRVDTVGKNWGRSDTEHWYAIIEGVYYGGTRGEPIYSWHPTDGWNADPTLPSADTWVNSTNPGAGEKARNFAFKKRDQVKFGTKYYKASRDIRYDTWDNDQHYSKGDKVSRYVDAGSGDTYWHSYKCIDGHNSSSATTAPGTGATYTDFWEQIKLSNILDDESNVTEDWTENPIARKSAVGAYYGNRLFVRTDDDDNWARLQYSAPANPEVDSDIADLDFNPTSWDPVDSFRGGGGGWFTVPFSGKGDAIRALYSYGTYLIIAGRWQSFVLAGTDEATWTLRKLGEYGAVGPQAIAELDGLVYMVGRHGYLVRTDGTQIEPVPGMEKIKKYLKQKLDTVIGSNDANWYPTVVAHDGKIWISLPVPAGSDNQTLVYDPETESFWKLDIPALDMTTGELSGVSRLFFSTAISGAASQSPCLFQLKDNAGAEVWTDDDWQATSGTAATSDITWRWRSAWFQFGITRIQRRIRRVWALVSGEASSTVAVTMYRNFNPNTAVTTGSRTLGGTATYDAEFVEGKVGQSGTMAHAVGVKLNGTANDRVGIHGVGVDTQVIRTRYKRS